MKAFLLLILSLVLAAPSFAATLMWDVKPDGGGPLTVEKGETLTGAYAPVATLPQGTTQFVLTPGAWGFYRVRNNDGVTNPIQFSLDQYTGDVTIRLDELEADAVVLKATDADLKAQNLGFASEFSIVKQDLVALKARVATLETSPVVTPPPPPAPTSNLTVRQIDADHIEVTCAGIGISTTGTGTVRVLTCKH